MQKKIIITSFFMMFLIVGCNLRPVKQIEESQVVYQLSEKKVEKAIRSAATRLGWKVIKSKDGEMTARVIARSHVATVRINYSAESYNIDYVDSANLKYQDGMIHRRYNNWVTRLDQQIQQQLLVMSN